MRHIGRRTRPTLVRLCGSNPVLGDQVSRQLVRRGLEVRYVPLGQLDASTVRPGEAFDLIVADLDIAEPELWQRAGALRTTFPYVPLLLLSDVRPRATDLDHLHPCAYICKPMTTHDLTAALDAVWLTTAPAPGGRLELSRAHE